MATILTRGRRSAGRQEGRGCHLAWTGDYECRRESPDVDAEGVRVGVEDCAGRADGGAEV